MFIDHVDYDSTISDTLTVEIDVPQGSILDPVHFIICMDDILMASETLILLSMQMIQTSSEFYVH